MDNDGHKDGNSNQQCQCQVPDSHNHQQGTPAANNANAAPALQDTDTIGHEGWEWQLATSMSATPSPAIV
jgi:hypothetical protein